MRASGRALWQHCTMYGRTGFCTQAELDESPRADSSVQLECAETDRRELQNESDAKTDHLFRARLEIQQYIRIISFIFARVQKHYAQNSNYC